MFSITSVTRSSLHSRNTQRLVWSRAACEKTNYKALERVHDSWGKEKSIILRICLRIPLEEATISSWEKPLMSHLGRKDRPAEKERLKGQANFSMK